MAVALLLFAAVSQVQAEPAPSVLDAEAHRIAVMDKAKDCVLAVFSPDGKGGGSGVVVSPDGYAITNFHVVLPCGKAMQCGMADGRIYDAVLVGVDPTGDVAIIKLFGREDFPCAELADSDRVRAGDWVFAMGNPFLLASDLRPTTTYGIVSGVHRYQFPADGGMLEYTDCIQTDASINPGNSGGPLFDADGRLIGINGRASFEKRGRVNVGAAYAISINQIKRFLGMLRGGSIVDHATLGATVESDAGGRVVVSQILETSDAYRRGLRYDDEIVSFGGRAISTPNGFKNVLGVFPKGWRVPLGFRRNGKRYDILVRLAGVHQTGELLDAMEPGNAKPQMEPQPEKQPGPKDKKEQKPEIPGMELFAPKIAVPEIVESHFQQKRGFANYYFNVLNQQRLWNAWSARTNLAGANGPWMLSGLLGTGGEFRLQIAEAGVALKLPSTEINWPAGDDFAASLAPAHSGGLMPALFLWRRLLVDGLDRFGQVHYEGAAPLVGHEGLVDVLVGSHKGVECRFYFDPAKGHLLALELFGDEESDPCELYFFDYHATAGHWLPGRLEVRHGDELFAAFRFDEFKIESIGK